MSREFDTVAAALLYAEGLKAAGIPYRIKLVTFRPRLGKHMVTVVTRLVPGLEEPV